MQTTKFKLMSATAGVGAVIAMGGLGAAFAATPDATENVSDSPDITLGETTTSTTAETEVETPSASPEVTAEPPPMP